MQQINYSFSPSSMGIHYNEFIQYIGVTGILIYRFASFWGVMIMQNRSSLHQQCCIIKFINAQLNCQPLSLSLYISWLKKLRHFLIRGYLTSFFNNLFSILYFQWPVPVYCFLIIELIKTCKEIRISKQ